MCGLFGFVARREKVTVNLEIIREVAEVTMSRGPHAWGMAWVTQDGRMRMFKQEGRIVDSLGMLAMAEGATMLIGHCRYATHGSPSNNLNNHPHPCDGGWLAHNGVIRNHEQILHRYGAEAVTDCDSEALAIAVEREQGKMLERCCKALVACRGQSPIAFLGLWRDRVACAADNGQPLHLGTSERSVYLGSLPGALPGRVTRQKAGEVVMWAKDWRKK